MMMKNLEEVCMLSLIINPGSTSTKAAIYKDQEQLCIENIRHTSEELAVFEKPIDQLDFRKNLVLGFLEKNNVALTDLDCIMSRGGPAPNVRSGATKIGDALIEALIERPVDAHISFIGPIIARDIAKEAGIPAFMYDPITVDELSPLAKMFGVKGIEHQSIGHVLNTRATGMAAAKELGKKFDEVTFIVVHIGGGNSVMLWKKGRLVDTIPADMGTFTAERCGNIRTGYAVKMCQEYGFDQMKSWLGGKGGFVSLLGTNELIKVEEMIVAGNEEALKAQQAMAYQLSRNICSLLPMTEGELDGVVFTGGGAYWQRLMDDMKKWLSVLNTNIYIKPGENEMQALADGAFRVMTGEEQANEYV